MKIGVARRRQLITKRDDDFLDVAFMRVRPDVGAVVRAELDVRDEEIGDDLLDGFDVAARRGAQRYHAKLRRHLNTQANEETRSRL